MEHSSDTCIYVLDRFSPGVHACMVVFKLGFVLDSIRDVDAQTSVILGCIVVLRQWTNKSRLAYLYVYLADPSHFKATPPFWSAISHWCLCLRTVHAYGFDSPRNPYLSANKLAILNHELITM